MNNIDISQNCDFAVGTFIHFFCPDISFSFIDRLTDFVSRDSYERPFYEEYLAISSSDARGLITFI